MRLNIAEQTLVEKLFNEGPEQYNPETKELGAYQPIRQVYARVDEMVECGILSINPSKYRFGHQISIADGFDPSMHEWPEKKDYPKEGQVVSAYINTSGMISRVVCFGKNATLADILSFV